MHLSAKHEMGLGDASIFSQTENKTRKKSLMGIYDKNN